MIRIVPINRIIKEKIGIFIKSYSLTCRVCLIRETVQKRLWTQNCFIKMVSKFVFANTRWSPKDLSQKKADAREVFLI